MPICKKCKNYFPNSITINNKIRSLQKRKYCLECSPFGQKNRKRLEEIQNKDGKEIRICKFCNREFEYNPSKGNKGWICNSCNANRKRHNRKLKCLSYKGNKCEICGYDKCPAALTFHHINRETKIFSIGGSHCISWEKVKIELDKCIVICSNCHNELHYNEDC